MKYKIQVGEWVNVYSTQTLVVDTDLDLDNAKPEHIIKLLENEELPFEIEKEDFDWTTEEHDKWDNNGEIKVLDKWSD